MVTKKWVEELIRKVVDERIVEHNRDDSETMTKVQKELGWNKDFFGVFRGWRSPSFSVHEKIEALYKYFRLETKREAERSFVVARKIKKGKKDKIIMI